MYKLSIVILQTLLLI